MSEVKLMVALDVGSTHSGYAYAFTTNSMDVRTSLFKYGGQEYTKVPTSILLNKDRKLLAFGHEAEETYIHNCNLGNENSFLYRRFKMDIHHNPTLGRKTKLKDVSGRHNSPAFEIMVTTIRFLKNHMIRALNVAMDTYSDNDCHFVVMVPGFWTDRAKAFMKTAALEAGIFPDRLTLVLESEAASLWQQASSPQKNSHVWSKGTKCMTIDLGGGTADLIVHESDGTGSVTSLDCPSGGLWGGSSTDDCFLSFLHLIFGSGVMKQFRTNCPGDFVKMMRGYEKSKTCRQAIVANGSFPVELPQKLLDLAKEHKGFTNARQLCEHVSSKCFGGNFELKQTTLCISGEQAQGMFDYTSKSLSAEISSLLTKSPSLREINHIVICGGFAASKTVQDFLTNSLKAFSIVTSNGLSVDFPSDGGLCPLKGAVYYGLNPHKIQSRTVKLTYGIKVTVPYNESRHNGGETKTINNVLMCTNAFHVLLKGGSNVKVGHQVIETDKPLNTDVTVQTFDFFSTGLQEDVPALTSHDTMNKEFEFSVPVPRGRNLDDKYFERSVTFGETELAFKVTFKRGKKEPYIKHISI